VEAVKGVDLMILRELTSDISFGEPRGIETLADGSRRGINTMSYTEAEIRRTAHAGFRAARARRGKLCSVDKANVLETMELWRAIVIEVGAEYPDVELSHLVRVSKHGRPDAQWPRSKSLNGELPPAGVLSRYPQNRRRQSPRRNP
jgi:isocitrate/isopropylmalate dehydrogenase